MPLGLRPWPRELRPQRRLGPRRPPPSRNVAKVWLLALRHTAATRLVRTGAPLAVTQRVLGHSNPKLTARVYTHLGAEDLRGAVERAAGGLGTEASGGLK